MAKDILDSMSETAREVDRWPDWMKLAMGVPVRKRTKQEKHDLALESFLKAWSDYMETYEVGKHSKELDEALKKFRADAKKKGKK